MNGGSDDGHPVESAGPARALFRAGPIRAVELADADIARLQQFFELNPEYFLAVTGGPPPRAGGA